MIEEKGDEVEKEKNKNVGVTNERGIELLHLLRITESEGPVNSVPLSIHNFTLNFTTQRPARL